MSGVQAGFVNTTAGNTKGLQSGFVNTAAGEMKGVQIGLINTAAGNIKGLQGGFVNTVAGEMKGAQIGFVNTAAGEMKGAQFGFVNTAAGEGAQIGFVNISTQKFKGVKLGFVNYSDSIEGSVPIGFISIVKKGGYRAIEYSFSEFYPVTLGFKIGIEKFYSTFFMAYNPSGEYDREHLGEHFASGFGIGSIIPITNFLFINQELNYLNSWTWWISSDSRSGEISSNFPYNTNSTFHVSSFVPSFGFKIGSHLSVTAGPSVTWVYNGNTSTVNPLFELAGFEINDNHRIVIGARAAVRLNF